MIKPYEILRRPILLSEKASADKEQHNQYHFEVPTAVSKSQIREAVETAFPQVKVLAVRTLIVRGKERRMGRGYARLNNWKKAIVTLRAEDKISYFEPVLEGG